MWRRIHVLDPVQSLVLASVSAAIIALPMAAQSVIRDETALLRNLFWPDTFNPYMTFSFVFPGVMLALLGYYHLGRLGFLLNLAAGFALVWIMTVVGIGCFVRLGRCFGRVWVSATAYAASVVIVYILIAQLHLRAARSQSIRDAQRKLSLLPARSL